MLELRQLKYFIRIAELEHFGKAAQDLHIVQPALTRQVKNLEEELGVELFERLPRGVRLTAAGKVLLERSQNLMADIERMTTATRLAGEGKTGFVRVGFADGTTYSGHMASIIRDFRKQSSLVELELLPASSMNQAELLLQNSIDLGFVYWLPKDRSNIKHKEINHEKVMLAIAETNKLSKQKSFRMKELQNLPFIWFKRSNAPMFYDLIATKCTNAGLMLNVVQEAFTESTMLSLVAADIGVTFISEAAAKRKPDNVVLRDISDLNATLTLKAMWRADDNNPALKEFVKALIKTTTVLLFFISSMFVSTMAETARPDETYLQYQQVLQTAKSMSEFNVFLPRKRQKTFDPLKDKRMIKEIEAMREIGPLNVKVIYWKQSGDTAVVQAAGTYRDYPDPKAPTQTQYCYVKMAREDGQWKIYNEDWLKEDFHLQPLTDTNTIAWCTGATKVAPDTTPAHGSLFNKSHELVRAIFYPRHHCLDIYTREKNYPSDNVKVSIQFPDSVTSLNQINVSKPGKTSVSGLKFGIELSRDASRVLNIFDNDDPYGLRIQTLNTESGEECFVSIRLPDAQHSYFCGRIPLKTWRYEQE
ncbi:MAG: LysR family transcriptional regulator [Candidatus Obscuribacterales bacterium]|nr:LysR family transcriptional regulator [Candidatus Obscuribacterales bacterium]